MCNKYIPGKTGPVTADNRPSCTPILDLSSWLLFFDQKPNAPNERQRFVFITGCWQRSLKTSRLTFVRMRNKCKINVQRNSKARFRYKCHELFGNSPVMITVKSFLKCRSMQ